MGISRAEIMRQKLEEAFTPTKLEVIDDSHKHSGHIGARPEGESHFTIIITSDDFAGKSRIERHRMMFGVLEEEKNDIHALSFKISDS